MDGSSEPMGVKLGECMVKDGKTKDYCKKLGDPSWTTCKVGSKM
jgi:hypothetical protein